MTQAQIKKIESSKQFGLFLIRFGVHGLEEYETFTNTEKMICIREFVALYPNFGK